MAGNTLDFDRLIVPDQMGTEISNYWVSWNARRQPWMDEVTEIRQYIFATDTTKTTNSKLPWKNKTCIPKACQIRDNLNSNYMAALFPKRKWWEWYAGSKDSSGQDKRKTIEGYMSGPIQYAGFKEEFEKLVLDYIDTGNAFATVEWMDNRVEQPDQTQVGFVGPVPRRISPFDIVFNPIAASFEKSPKIIRSIVSIGEVKEILDRLSTDENKEAYEQLYNYMLELRMTARTPGFDLAQKDASYNVDGFDSYQAYLQSDCVELLTFYGDIFDFQKKKFLKNHVVIVADRHKVLSAEPNKSFFGYPPIFHVGWRVRQDNLWAMGPLANLIGMQYRIDHLENLKADCFDLIAFPPLKIKGFVQDFEWAPFAKIYVQDNESDVEVLQVPFQVLQTNGEIQAYMNTMEELAGSPKEAMGFRTPGEKTAYEVQRLENAASRIFQNKITQFEEKLVEKVLNAMLELARRNISSAIEMQVYDDEFNSSTFEQLDPAELVGAGCLKPVAARHFAEKAERIQNLNNFFTSTIGQDQDIKAHFSSIKLARMFEQLLDIEEFEIVVPYIRLAEQKEAQALANAAQEQVMMEGGTPSGLTPDDFDPEVMGDISGTTNPMDQAPVPSGQGY